MDINGNEIAEQASYARMLYDCRNHITFVPDLTTAPTILTNANINTNYPFDYIGDGITNAPGNGAVLVRPNFNAHTTTLGVINPSGVRFKSMSSNIGDVVVDRAMFVPQENVPMSRNLAASYTYLRPIASFTGIQSATTSTTNASLSGTFDVAAFNDLNDFSTFTPGELADIAVTTKDYAVNVPVRDGVIYTPGPEILQPMTVPQVANSTSTFTGTGVYVQTPAVGPVVFTTDLKPLLNQTVSGQADYPLNIPTTLVGGKLKVEINIRSSAQSFVPGDSVGFIFAKGFTGQVTLENTPVAGPFADTVSTQGSLALDGNHSQSFSFTLDLDRRPVVSNYVIKSPGNNTSVLLPVIGVVLETQGTFLNGQNVDYFSVSVTPYNQATFTGSGPGSLILFQGLATGMTVQTTQLVAYEAVPNGPLSKDVKTSSYRWRKRDPSEITAAETLFNSPNLPVRRVYSGPVFNNMESAGLSFDKAGIFRNASFFGDLAGIIGTVAPIIGGAFGPQYAPIGAAIGGIANSFRGASGIPRSAAALEDIGYRGAAGIMNTSTQARNAAKRRFNPYIY